jgi:hypothetical protein
MAAVRRAHSKIGRGERFGICRLAHLVALAHSVALRHSGYRKSLLVDKFFGGSTPDKIELSLPSSCEASKAIAGACEA